MVDKAKGRNFFPLRTEKALLFKVVRVLVTSMIFTLFYWFVIPKISKSWEQWLFILFSISFSVIVGSATSRFVTKSTYRDDKDVQYVSRFIMIVVLYGTLIWGIHRIGAFEYMNYGFTLIFFLVAKTFIFLLSDYLADKLTFGG